MPQKKNTLFEPVRNWLRRKHGQATTLPSAEAYDLWSAQYDNQPGNLMLDMDEQVFGDLWSPLAVTGKKIADIGCGTGRHWQRILDQRPAQLTGFDVSPGMLGRLKAKFPAARTNLITDDSFSSTPDRAFDVIVSTLTIAHLPDAGEAVNAWCRLLAPGGDLIITDFHPDTLAAGGQRTFVVEERLMAVRNYVFPVEQLEGLLSALGLEPVRKIERCIDPSLHHYYAAKNALHVYDRFLNAKIIYGLHYRKPLSPA